MTAPAMVLGRQEDGIHHLTIIDMTDDCDNVAVYRLTEDEIREMAADLLSLTERTS